MEPSLRRPFRWTPTKRAVLDLVLAGVPKIRVAAALHISRTTVAAWCGAPEFVTALRERLAERMTATRLARLHETALVGARLHQVCVAILDRADHAPDNPSVLKAAQTWLATYQAVRAEERADTAMAESIRLGRVALG